MKLTRPSKRLKYMPLEEVHQLLKRAVEGRLRQESVPVFNAYKRVLAEDIVSDVDIPPFSISHFDGYAVRAEDTLQASNSNPAMLKVVGRSYLDNEYVGRVKAGEAVYVSTGCTLPDGADAVVPIELAEAEGDLIKVRRSFRVGENVVPAGADVRRGERVFPLGHVLRAQDIKFLADIGRWNVKVFKKPTVAIASIGNELTDRVEEVDGKKFNSHKLMISLLVEEAGGVPLDMGVVADDVDAIRAKLKIGLEKADIVATIGGASVGERDYVWEAANMLGAPEAVVRGIKVQPGRVTSLCMLDGKPIVMLPGHVQSTLVGFYSILLPLLHLMSGLTLEGSHVTVKAKVSRKLVVREYPAFERIRFVSLRGSWGDYVAEPVTGDSSLVSVVVKSDGFIMVPAGKDSVEEGEEVNVHFLRGLFPMASS